LQVGLALGEELDAGGIEQHVDRRHEHHGQKVAAQSGDDVPARHAEIVKIPGLGQPHGSRGVEHPPAEACIFEAEPGQCEAEVSGKRSCDQDAGQHKAAVGAPPQGKIKRERQDGRRSELCQGHRPEQRFEIGKGQSLVGDHAHRAADHEPAGGAKKAADHRVGDKADGGASTGKAEGQEEDAGPRSAP